MLLTRPWYPFGSWRGALAEMDRLRREMDRILESLSGVGEAGLFPPVNVSEDTDRFTVTAELPGVDPKEIDISVHGRNLSISGERKPPQVEEGARYHRRERPFGSFSRMIGLPVEVDPEKVEATYRNGVLTIVLPKAEEAKPKKIAVSG
jgi:HSP20 family protein